MNYFSTVFAFEFRSLLEKKTIRISTMILAILIFLLTSIPTVVHFYKELDLADEPAITTGHLTGNIAFFLAGTLNETYIFDHLNIQAPHIYADEESLLNAIETKEIDGGFILYSSDHYKEVVLNQSMIHVNSGIFEDVMKNLLRNEWLEQAAIDPNMVETASNLPLEIEKEILGKDAVENFFIAYIFIILVYLLITLYGSTVSGAVAREKENRTMELLITSTTPETLILGKVSAAGLMGIFQIMALLLSAILGFILNKNYYPSFIFDLLANTMDIGTIFVFSIFSVLGYTLYLFIYAALGSLVSKLEDVNSASTPVTILMMIAFFGAMMALQFPDTKIVQFASFIPFVSIFIMPIRYSLVGVSGVELLLSAALLIITTIFIGGLSIYIYKFGSLHYGNKIKLRDMLSKKLKDMEDV